MEKNKDTPTKNEKSWEDFVRALPKMEKNMLRENAPLQPKVIFHIIREEGEEEMSRSFRALAFSALAAGVFVSLSFLFRACFRMYMAEYSWEPLISSLGYTVGFLIVILGRMQLFTENPITTIIPVLEEFSWKRLWYGFRPVRGTSAFLPLRFSSTSSLWASSRMWWWAPVKWPMKSLRVRLILWITFSASCCLQVWAM